VFFMNLGAIDKLLRLECPALLAAISQDRFKAIAKLRKAHFKDYEELRWARGQAKLAAEFLAGFGVSLDPGAPPVRAEALALVFEALPPGTAEREEARRALDGVRRLHTLAGMAAAEYERRKGKPRQSDRTLHDLFVAIAIAYLRACGGRLGAS
jgi:hypothetical protein